MKKFFTFSFLPTSVDLGLLLLRVMFGGLMLTLHGWQKLMGYSKMFDTFPAPLSQFGIGHQLSYVLVTGGEVLGSFLIVLGLATRFCALWLAIIMGVAFFMAHGGALSGPRSGEMALLFLTGFFVLLISGPGRFSIDAKMGAK
jgi:putative oxidoreductase